MSHWKQSQKQSQSIPYSHAGNRERCQLRRMMDMSKGEQVSSYMNNRKNAHGTSRFKNGDQQLNKPRENVRFNTSAKHPQHDDEMGKSNNRNTEKNVYTAVYPSDTEPDVIFSDYYYDDDDESQLELMYDSDEYARRAFDRMETKMNLMTEDFVHNVKSEIDETFSKLMLQQKKEKSRKYKVNEKGAGDGKKINSMENDVELKRLLKKKNECYSQISTNLEILQQIDQLTDKLYKNHVNFVKK